MHPVRKLALLAVPAAALRLRDGWGGWRVDRCSWGSSNPKAPRDGEPHAVSPRVRRAGWGEGLAGWREVVYI
eukprot:scaffold2201_cov110-Isochrysis_galbana.AAC.2